MILYAYVDVYVLCVCIVDHAIQQRVVALFNPYLIYDGILNFNVEAIFVEEALG